MKHTPIGRAIALFALVHAASAQDWPHWRGTDYSGCAAVTATGGALALKPVWTSALGSAYSGVVISDGYVVTMSSDEERDFVVALDAARGEELWRVDLGAHYLGHDGSEDGPVSSPTIDAKRVFAVGPRGALVAIGLTDGAELWRKSLQEDFGAEEPEYGFTTTPLVEDGVLVVQAGGSEGRAVIGLDPATGEVAWSIGTGVGAYQSPVALELCGRRHVVVLNGKELLGLGARDGKQLWRHEFSGPRESAGLGVATAIEANRFCIPLAGTTAIFELSGDEANGYALREVSRTREIGQGYAAPVYRNGHLYGFKSDFLTCVDLSTGKRAWKSRPPGGNGLILVGDKLVVFGAEGVLAVVAATPEGYFEETRIDALRSSSYTWPSYAGGRAFVRNNEQLACAELVARQDPALGAGGLGVADAAATDADSLREIVAEIEAASAAPIVTGNTVRFFYRGAAEDVAIGGSMVDGPRPDPLQRIPGSDIWTRAYTIEPGARWEYQFQLDYDRWIADPANPRTSPAAEGDIPMSEVVTPGYVAATHFTPDPDLAADRRGRLEPLDFKSEQLGNERKIQVYLPAGYDASEEAYPLLIVHQGSGWIERGGLVHTLDNCIGTSVRPVVVAFIEQIPRWWYEGGGTGTDRYVDMLATELVPFLEAKYRLLEGPENRALMGMGPFGMTVTFAVLRQPAVFGKAAIQSLSLEDVSRHAIFALIAAGPPGGAFFYIDWNRYEERSVDRGYDLREQGPRLARALEAGGCTVVGGEAIDSNGWGSWRSRSDRWLGALFGL